MEACDQLQSELIQLVEQPADPLVLDLSELTFICSLGLGALIDTYLRAASKSTVRVVSPNPNIRALLEVTKLVKLFPPYDSVENAIAKP
jgi:anti-anti-sigma factor